MHSSLAQLPSSAIGQLIASLHVEHVRLRGLTPLRSRILDAILHGATPGICAVKNIANRFGVRQSLDCIIERAMTIDISESERKQP